MPFKLGAAPIRRTVKYLSAAPLVFRDVVKIMSVNYNVDEETLYVKERPSLHPVRKEAMGKKPWWIRAGQEHKGVTEFVFWNLPQVQYRNPEVQVVAFKNMTPSPFITCYLGDGKQDSYFPRPCPLKTSVYFDSLQDEKFSLTSTPRATTRSWTASCARWARLKRCWRRRR
jgi:hypothetical protein